MSGSVVGSAAAGAEFHALANRDFYLVLASSMQIATPFSMGEVLLY
jgi:hypothetical protein